MKYGGIECKQDSRMINEEVVILLNYQSSHSSFINYSPLTPSSETQFSKEFFVFQLWAEMRHFIDLLL